MRSPMSDSFFSLPSEPTMTACPIRTPFEINPVRS